MSRLFLIALAALPLQLLHRASAHAVTVKLTAADGAHVQASLHPGDILRIELPAEPAGGHQWVVQGNAPAQLVELGKTQRIFGGRMSNQGTSSFAWRALSPGEGELTLAYGRPATRTSKPEKTLLVQLTVSGEPLGPEEAQPTPISQLEQTAAYERTEPCGDCSALQEQLLLYRAPRESPYVLRRIYKDAPGGTLTSVMTGSWSSQAGSADPSATLYELANGTEAPSIYRVDEDHLVPLDAQQIPIPSPPGMDNTFHKVAIE